MQIIDMKISAVKFKKLKPYNKMWENCEYLNSTFTLPFVASVLVDTEGKACGIVIKFVCLDKRVTYYTSWITEWQR